MTYSLITFRLKVLVQGQREKDLCGVGDNIQFTLELLRVNEFEFHLCDIQMTKTVNVLN